MAGAFLGMGTWAMFANRSHGAGAALTAGVVQGALSAVITLGLKRLVEAMAVRLPGLAGLIVPPVVAWAVSAGLLTAIHTLAGTPELLATIALPNAVATLYATLYSVALWRART
jgi:hypothetical protein